MPMRLTPLRRRTSLAGTALLLLPLAGCSGGSPPRGVLLITIDTLRADHVGAYGAGGDPTPNLDRLADRGVRFEDASTPVPITLPAHASLLTGLLPPVHGVRDNGEFRLPPGPPTLAEILGGAGYTTGAVVGAVVLDSVFGLDRGFRHYDDRIALPPRTPAEGVASYPDRPAEAVVDAALAWLRDLPPGERFFLWVHLFDPHAPYRPPEPARHRFGETYAGEVSYVDAQVGRLLDGLVPLGREKTTLVVLTSDHGEGLGEHGETTHGFLLHQSTVHVPLIFSGPGLPSGEAVVPDPVSLVDVLPTVLALCGVESPAEIDGLSLVPSMLGQGLPPRSLYMETFLPYYQMRWSGSRGLRDGSWKLIQSGARDELFHLASDPREDRDRAASEPEIAASLEATLEVTGRSLDARRRGEDVAAPVDEATRSQLRTLGYLAGGVGTPADLEARARRRPPTRERLHLVDAIQEAVPAALDRGDPEGLRRLRALAAEDGDNPRLLTLLGRALVAQGRPEEAREVLARALELDPQDSRARVNLASVLLRLGRPEEAGAAVRDALATDALDPDVRRLQGSLLLSAGDAARAEQVFRDLLQERPDDAGSLAGLGRALAAQRRWEESLGPLRRFLDRYPGSAEEAVLAGTAAHRMERIAEAEAWFRQALEVESRNVGALVGTGILAGERGDDADAARWFAAALEAAPDDPRVLTLHGIAAARAGDLAAARRSLRRSLELDPGQAGARETLHQIGG